MYGNGATVLLTKPKGLVGARQHGKMRMKHLCPSCACLGEQMPKTLLQAEKMGGCQLCFTPTPTTERSGENQCSYVWNLQGGKSPSSASQASASWTIPYSATWQCSGVE